MNADILLPATLVITGLIVVVLVAYLIAIIIALRKAGNHLQRLASKLQNVADDTSPLGDRLDTINGALGHLHEGLHSVDKHLIGIAKTLKL